MEVIIEQVWATIEPDDRSIHIDAIYIPPGSSSDVYTCAANFTTALGDYNRKNKWAPDIENSLANLQNALEKTMYDIFPKVVYHKSAQ